MVPLDGKLFEARRHVCLSHHRLTSSKHTGRGAEQSPGGSGMLMQVTFKSAGRRGEQVSPGQTSCSPNVHPGGGYFRLEKGAFSNLCKGPRVSIFVFLVEWQQLPKALKIVVKHAQSFYEQSVIQATASGCPGKDYCVPCVIVFPLIPLCSA